ncbi:uncharacterized protein PRCAT00005706001 [Priceomyces carsonii]|uniref:uncharacterized protein n=1 Tax=Priceomyces carsonii TaxID=28549 RepID=UPI002EDB51E7|nr:unnamed protein product [Priceomyces carsonii]
MRWQQYFRLNLLLIFHLFIDISEASSNASTDIIQPKFTSRNFDYKGVALGGWLVLEPYITPSLFLSFNTSKNASESDIPVDEYHYCKKLGYDEAKKRLTKHWETWYTEEDFAKIKDYGLNMVRIPIGYWAFHKMSGDPYVSGAQRYLDKALIWAKKYDLKAWIDLHGVPGSQNGFDNSGLRDIGYPGWFNKTEHITLTEKVLHQIFSKYGNLNSSKEYEDTILGIEIVNEPLGAKLSMHKLKSFYEKVYEDARATQVVNNTFVIHDAFEAIGYWNSFLTNDDKKNSTTDNYNVLIDHHHYQVFSVNSLNSSINDTLQSIKDYSSSIQTEMKHHPAVVGEWSAALTDCTPWLNGVGLGSRYEGTKPYTNEKIGSCSNINNWSSWDAKVRKNYRKFIEMQLYEYEKQTKGWIFWCFKSETSIEWDFLRLVDLNLMPQPLNNYTYIINGKDTDSGKKKSCSPGASSGISLALAAYMLVFLCI